MATLFKTAVVIFLLLFILMEGANPVLAGKGNGKFKKLEARVKKLEQNMEEQEKCKACSLIDQLTQRLNEIDKDIEEMKNPTTVVPPIPEVSECHHYRTLTEADRKVTSDKTARKCDKPFFAGWYRFEGAAGTKMPTSPPGEGKCNTDGAGWLTEGHPFVAEGKVPRQVCFHWNSNTCYYKVDIEVRNCGSFYVYNLKEVSGCHLRYCSTD